MWVEVEMAKRYDFKRPDLVQAVVDELNKSHDKRSGQRLYAAWLAGHGAGTAQEIADAAKISRRRFFDWMKALNGGGVAGLLKRQHGGGRVPKLQGAVREEMTAGLQCGRWKRAKEIQHWLQEQHGIWLDMPAVYFWAGKLRRALKEKR